MQTKLTFFEPIFQELRIRQVLPHIPADSVLVDIGCDQPQVLIDRVRSEMKRCVGIDRVVAPHKDGNVEIKRQEIATKLLVESNSADIVTLLAVLEHLKHPLEIMKESFRILRKGGVLLITVPAPHGRPLLELFATLGLVRKEMIEQHEHYFTKKELQELCRKAGFKSVEISSFEFGFNTFVKAKK